MRSLYFPSIFGDFHILKLSIFWPHWSQGNYTILVETALHLMSLLARRNSTTSHQTPVLRPVAGLNTGVGAPALRRPTPMP